MIVFLINFLALLFSLFVAGCMLGVVFSRPFRDNLATLIGVRLRRDGELAKVSCNPILTPGTTYWNAEAVFNPAAISLTGRTHLVYRSIGMDGVSRLGYASSRNGIQFDEQLPHPIYASENPRNLPGKVRRYNPVLYPSGGSWGGCEDPRMVALGGRVYLTFNSFDGWDFIRVAVISISQEDFLAKRWRWSPPTLLSMPNQIHKNWVLFPEKINGKFAILHSVVPKIEVAYRTSLEGIGTSEPFVESWEGARSNMRINENSWDQIIRSAGPPPVKTPHGWLLFYHATEEKEWHRYKLGAMLLDLEDPTKVLYRSTHPILMPDEWYENNGKPGVVYACGAVAKDGMLYIYYGGGDKVICVAFAPLAPFLKSLMRGAPVAFTATPVKK